MMNGLEVKALTLSLLNSETQRDKQRKVGASQISDLCDLHFAKALAGEKQEASKYWLGGKIGTAIHGLLEALVADSDEPDLVGAQIEQKISLGELDGYGEISSKPDLYLPARKHLIDWKTSSRDKMKKLKKLVEDGIQDADTEYTISKYIGQTQLYAWGLNQSGKEVEGISLVFINRDGTNEADVWEHTYPYDESIAVGLWKRLEWLWGRLQDGEHPESFNGKQGCFLCATRQ